MPLNCVVFTTEVVHGNVPNPVSVYVPGAPVITDGSAPVAQSAVTVAVPTFLGGTAAFAYDTVPETEFEPLGVDVEVAVGVFVLVAVGVLWQTPAREPNSL